MEEKNKEAKVLEIKNEQINNNELATLQENKGFFKILKRNFEEYRIQKEQDKIIKATQLVQDKFSLNNMFNEVKTTTRNTPFNDGLYYEFKTEEQIKRSL